MESVYKTLFHTTYTCRVYKTLFLTLYTSVYNTLFDTTYIEKGGGLQSSGRCGRPPSHTWASSGKSGLPFLNFQYPLSIHEKSMKFRRIMHFNSQRPPAPRTSVVCARSFASRFSFDASVAVLYPTITIDLRPRMLDKLNFHQKPISKSLKFHQKSIIFMKFDRNLSILMVPVSLRQELRLALHLRSLRHCGLRHDRPPPADGRGMF